MFRIGEFARLGGVSAKALRNYDLRGIFGPAWVDPRSGYRYYSPAQLPELRRVIALKDLGLPLAEVAELLAGGADLRVTLQRRRRELEDSRASIARKLAALDIRVEMADSGPDVVVRRVEPQLVAGIRAIDPAEDVAALFYELESTVKDAGARAPLPPGMLIDQNGESPGFEVFVPVTRPVDSGRAGSHRLPALRVASLIHRGPYEGMPDAGRSLEEWITAAGYEQADRTRILYLQFGAEPELELPEAYLAEQDNDFVTEIQVPVVSR
ncbi:MAG: MerR family transcriptional regulator [Actinobacteria bacterium]|nr:MAG: MerR family transcriptional regulator [Actinomycetota bacterium]